MDNQLNDDGTAASSTTGSSPATSSADLVRMASDPALPDDLALAFLKRVDLPPEFLDQLAKNAGVVKNRKVKIAIASHPHTPRHVSVPLARQFYTFDLMKVALSPGVPADVKVAIDDVLISRLKSVTVGERLTLARRASGRVAAALLLDVENMDGKVGAAKIVEAATMARKNRVLRTALENARLTEALVISSILRPNATAALVQIVAQHAKWSKRREIRAALLRTEHLSLARALEFSREIPVEALRDVLGSSRLRAEVKAQLLRENETLR